MIPTAMLAGTKGILKGKVLDEEGKGIIGATIFLMGTTQGTSIKNPNGTYIINNIPAGTYEVRYSAVGKAKVIKKIQISADKITDSDVVLVEEGTMTETLIITADKFTVDQREQGSIDVIDDEQIKNTADQSLAGVVTRTAGVQTQGQGFSIRGARDEDTQIRVDGVDVSNKFTGGMGPGGTRYTPMISSLAVSEVQVIKGGFSAEYGEVLGGVVNSQMKTGRNDGYEGYVQYETDLPSLNGSQSDGLAIERRGDRLEILNRGDGYKWQGANEHKVDLGIGGPIPGLNGLLNSATFFINTNYLYEEFRQHSYEIYDPAGNNLGQMPNNQTWTRNIEGRMKFALPSNIDLILGGGWGMTNAEQISRGWLYYDQPAMLFDDNMQPILDAEGNYTYNDVPAYKAKYPAWNILQAKWLARINHSISNTMYYQLEINNAMNRDESARRANTDDPSFFGGFDLLEPQDNFTTTNSRDIRLKTGNDNIIDQYTQILMSGSTSTDGYYAMNTKPVANPMTGYIEGGFNTSGHTNPYGMQDAYAGYATAGNAGFSFRRSNLITFKGHIENNLLKGDFSHWIKAGFQFRTYTLHRHSNSNPWDGNPFYDVYTDDWGGNLYANPETDQELIAKTSEPFNPIQGSAFIQDQIEYKGIIFMPGLRFDFFSPNEDHRNYDPNNIKFIRIIDDESFKATDPKFQISPRINVSYPITANSNILFSYGQFFKMPDFQYMYDNYNLELLRSGITIGNPNLEPQRTNMYEITYKNRVTRDFIFEATAYYKDIYNQLGLAYFPAVPEPFFEYTVAEYGSARGVELGLRKRRADNISLGLNYTLGKVDGTSSSPNTNAGRQIDPFTDKFALPLAAYPLSWDVRHRLKADVSVFWDNNEGPSIGGIQFLENSNFTFQYSYRSGFPYTKADRDGTLAGEFNAERGPSFWQVDFRLSKTFLLGDWFGDSFARSALQVFFKVDNLLNRTVPVAVYSTTNDPDDPGQALDRQIGSFPSTTYYEHGDPSNPASVSAAQYDDFGNRRYNEAADFDGNGTLTQAEHYQAYINYLEDAMAFRGNYSIPRRIYFGVNVSF